MRIPSQFNQDNLYRRDNRHRRPTSSYRRVIRLAIGLAVVVVVMRHAARPEMYQTFFDPSVSTAKSSLRGGGVVDPSQGATNRSQLIVPVSDVEDRRVPTVDAEDRRIANQIAAQLLPTDQRLWLIVLDDWLNGQSATGEVPSSIESIASDLESNDSLDEKQRANWIGMLDAIDTMQQSSPEPLSDAIEESSDGDLGSAGRFLESNEEYRACAFALLSALDAAALSRVVDGSVWRAGDFDSLYRFLDQAREPPPDSAASTGVLPLLQQPDVFRSQWVRVGGGVARSERIEAEANPFGITHYYQLWLRPNDGADRPMVAIVLDIPDAVEEVGAQSTDMEGPSIEVVGRYLKRLAYQSGAGADLAPVIVGQITSAPMTENELALSDSPVDVNATKSIGWIVLLACLIGIASAALVMWRTSISATRARELRASRHTASDAFLNNLSGPNGDDHSTLEES